MRRTSLRIDAGGVRAGAARRSGASAQSQATPEYTTSAANSATECLTSPSGWLRRCCFSGSALEMMLRSVINPELCDAPARDATVAACD